MNTKLFNLNNKISVSLNQKTNGIMVSVENIGTTCSALFLGQTFEVLETQIIANFNTIYSFLEYRKSSGLFKASEYWEIDKLSAIITIDEMCCLNRQERYDLTLNTDFLQGGFTTNKIVEFYKKKYPKDWKERVLILLAITEAQLTTHIEFMEHLLNR